MKKIHWRAVGQLPYEISADPLEVDTAYVLDGTVRFPHDGQYWAVPLDLVAAIQQELEE